MNRSLKSPAICVLLLALTTSAQNAELTIGELALRKAIGRDCPVVPLWPDGKGPDEPRPIAAEVVATSIREAAEALLVMNVSSPSFTVISPSREKNNGATLVLCPGGGYGGLHFDPVLETAEFFRDRGYTTVLLKYRVPKRHQGYGMSHHPLQDAQRAIGILRTRAKEWNVDPQKIGVVGFSAGGHLAASLSNNFAKRLYEPVDDFDQASCKPDFAVLLYPAYLTDPILSRTPDPGLHFEQISKSSTPPTFITVTMPDKFTIGSAEYSLALQKKDVPFELHVYATGGHGGGIAKYPFGEWAKECHRWLGDVGIVKASEKQSPFTYKAAGLPEIEPVAGLTRGDQQLRQILGRDCPVIPLWPQGLGPDETLKEAPEVTSHKSRGGTALNITNVFRPTLTVVAPPDKPANGKAVIVCPGGAYSGLAAEHEGLRVCEWLNEQGITGILLKYRVPRRGGEFPKHHHALQDLQRAMRIARANADAWKLDPQQLGVCGFSAGGHLCAALCAQHGTIAYTPIDDRDKLSCRPDFGMLIYPAYLTEPIDSNDLDPLFKESLARNTTPPLFLAVARNDRFSIGMLNFYLAVREARVPAECHVYTAGGHGGGIDPVSYPSSEWPKAALRWLKDLDEEHAAKAAR